MRYIRTAATVAVLAGTPVAAAAQTAPNVGYVSAARVLAESTEGKSVVARITAFQQQKVAELRVLQEKYEATRRELAAAVDNDTRAKLQVQEMQERTAGERAAAQINAEIQNFQRQAHAELQNRVRPVVDEIAKAKGLQIVLNADTSIAWAVAALDLTPAVVERLNTPPLRP